MRRRNIHLLPFGIRSSRETSDTPDPELPTKWDFFWFMRERESIRILREVLERPPEMWTSETTMSSIRLTNVHRSDDKVSRAVTKKTSSFSQDWIRDAEGTRRLALAGLLVFNVALFRALGSVDFVEGLCRVEGWDAEAQGKVVNAAVELFKKRHHCFTDAYDPSRGARRCESGCLMMDESSGEARFRNLVEGCCRRLKPLWEERERVAHVALETRSWKAATKALMDVHGYGGTGFLAKEVMQDLISTPLFKDWDPKSDSWVDVCTDTNDWCAVGPGARRGLNRLHRRPTWYRIWDSSPEVEQQFLTELKDLYECRTTDWPEQLQKQNVESLVLHDIQFQLCEFDKYCRARLGEGRVRLFRRPGTTSALPAPARVVKRQPMVKREPVASAAAHPLHVADMTPPHFVRDLD